jgi:hypothetical protein
VNSVVGTGVRGDRLPAHRELAAKLGVNRSTIITAFEELAAEGLIRSRIGSGTFIHRVPATRPGNSEKEHVPPSPMPWSALLFLAPLSDLLSSCQNLGMHPGVRWRGRNRWSVAADGERRIVVEQVTLTPAAARSIPVLGGHVACPLPGRNPPPRLPRTGGRPAMTSCSSDGQEVLSYTP